jgi:hypothetical protein
MHLLSKAFHYIMERNQPVCCYLIQYRTSSLSWINWPNQNYLLHENGIHVQVKLHLFLHYWQQIYTDQWKIYKPARIFARTRQGSSQGSSQGSGKDPRKDQARILASITQGSSQGSGKDPGTSARILAQIPTLCGISFNEGNMVVNLSKNLTELGEIAIDEHFFVSESPRSEIWGLYS